MKRQQNSAPTDKQAKRASERTTQRNISILRALKYSVAIMQQGEKEIK